LSESLIHQREIIMRSLIKLAVVLLICFVVIGFFLGWFSFSSHSSNADGDKVDVQMSVDKAKMKEDVKKAKEKVKEEVNELEDRVKAKEGN
jgi:hypothetical protein